MAKEFFELWRENSIVKKIIAVLLIAGAVAAALVSIFSLKDTVVGKEKSSGGGGSIVVSGNAVGPNATINNNSHNSVVSINTDSEEKK